MISALSSTAKAMFAFSCIALLGALWFAWGASYNLPRVATPDEHVPAAEATVAHGASENQFASSFAERPLFSPTRRPPAAIETATDNDANENDASVAQAQAKADALIEAERKRQTLHGYRLVGTVLRQGEKLALIQHQDQEDAITLKTGDEIEGWALVTVLADRITLTRGDEELIFSLQTTDGAPEVAQKSNGPGHSGPARLYRPPPR